PMPRWTLDWRRGPIEVVLPDDGSVTTVQRDPLPELGAPADLVRKAIDDPIGCPPLGEMVKRGDRVALLVTDMQDRALGQQGVGDLLLDELNRAGVPDKNVTIVHAAGMHGHPGAHGRVGERLIGRVGGYVEHDPFDE